MLSLFDAANGVSIVDVIERFSSKKVRGARGNVSCPFHEDKKPSFHVYMDSNSYFCFSCKSSGTPVNFVAQLKGITPEAAAMEICSSFGIEYRTTPVSPEYKDYISVYEMVAKLFNYYNRHTEALPRDYWNKRGLGSVVDDYLLGYCPTVLLDKDGKVLPLKRWLMDRFPAIPEATLDTYGLYDKYGSALFAGRYMFPIRDKKGNVVAFSGRSIDPADPRKYYNTAENEFFQKRTLLYNLDRASKYPTIIICEGYCDALSLVVQGISNVVASMGTALTKEHFELLRGKEIILSLDNDDPGKKSMVDLIEKYPQILFRVYEIQKYKDFNEGHMDKFLFQDIDSKHLVYGPEFMIRYFKRTLDLSDLRAREEMYNRVNAVAKYHSPIARDYFSVILQRLIKGARADV